MSCDLTRETLMGLEPSAFSTVAHLADCAACQAFADEIRAMDAVMGDVVDGHAEAGDFEAEWAAAQAEARADVGRRWWSMGGLATLAAAALVLVVLRPGLTDPPVVDPDPAPMATPVVLEPAAAPAPAEEDPKPAAEPTPEPMVEPEPEPAPQSKPRPRPRPKPSAPPRTEPTPVRPPPAPTPARAPAPAPAPVPIEPAEMAEMAEPEMAEPASASAPTAYEPAPDPAPAALTIAISGGPVAVEVRCPSGFQEARVASGQWVLHGMPAERCAVLVEGRTVGHVRPGATHQLTRRGTSWVLTGS